MAWTTTHNFYVNLQLELSAANGSWSASLDDEDACTQNAFPLCYLGRSVIWTCMCVWMCMYCMWQTRAYMHVWLHTWLGLMHVWWLGWMYVWWHMWCTCKWVHMWRYLRKPNLIIEPMYVGDACHESLSLVCWPMSRKATMIICYKKGCCPATWQTEPSGQGGGAWEHLYSRNPSTIAGKPVHMPHGIYMLRSWCGSDGMMWQAELTWQLYPHMLLTDRQRWSTKILRVWLSFKSQTWAF